jgi:hypothetical protein
MLRRLLALASLATLACASACDTTTGTTCTGPDCPTEGTSSSSGGTTSGDNPPGTSTSSGSTSSGGTPGAADAGGKACYGTASSCWCGDFSAWGQGSQSTQTPSCSKGSGATYCCKTNDFPSGGSCVCSDTQPNCQESVFGDTCTCSLAHPDSTDKPVSSCTAKAGGVCCLEPSVLAPMCSCFDTLSTCPSGGTPVPSCSTADLKCDGQSVDTCSY